MDTKTLRRARELSSQMNSIKTFLELGKGIGFAIRAEGCIVIVEGEGKLYDTIMAALHTELSTIEQQFVEL